MLILAGHFGMLTHSNAVYWPCSIVGSGDTSHISETGQVFGLSRPLGVVHVKGVYNIFIYQASRARPQAQRCG